jgi:hypothetical protein
MPFVNLGTNASALYIHSDFLRMVEDEVFDSE